MASARSPELLSELIGLIYESALDPSRWTVFLDRFAQAVDGQGTSIFMHDFASSESAVAASGSGIGAMVRFDPAYLQSFVEHYDQRNVWAQNHAALAEGVGVTSDMLYPDAKLYGTEWGADWLKPQDLKYCLGGVVMRRGTVAVKFTTLRPPSRGAFGSDELALYEVLLPHLRRASLVHLRMHQLTGMHDASIERLDALAFGVLFLSSGGSVLHLNAFARHLAARRDGFAVDALGRCRLGSNGEEVRLSRMIHDAARTAGGDGVNAGGAMRITRRSGRPLAVSVAPVRSAHVQGFYDLGITPSVVVMLSDPDAVPRTTADTLCALYGLTPAEAKLAAAIVGGVQPGEYAQQRSVTKNTVATQVKSVIRKLGARRQADIVRIVLNDIAFLDGSTAMPRQ